MRSFVESVIAALRELSDASPTAIHKHCDRTTMPLSTACVHARLVGIAPSLALLPLDLFRSWPQGKRIQPRAE